MDEEIATIDEEISSIDEQILDLKNKKRDLQLKRENIISKKDIEESKKLSDQNWERTDFEWSERLQKTLEDVFKIKSFRPQQLSAINATLSGHHCIVIMPTGAGKSLCFQLPALVNDGITIVISPLISLMEDQVFSLTKRNIPAKLLTSTSSTQETTATLNEMIDKNSKTKLFYVTPERLAKSKRFMAKLQKCFEMGRLQRIAIDEVHCCSQWGHDFRPDYKFLGVLSAMFPGVPILGLTATATAHILKDTIKMLDIRGCLSIKSSFNRPNLYYQIVEKPSSLEDCVDLYENLLKGRYKNQSGIIYVTSIKDSEDIAQGLRKTGLKVACYHANLEAAARSSIHSKWTEKYYQAIVATVAFGLGIDKPDVRFVLHHSLSKAMESYYQESGRAGRDGQRADCIMLFRMQDIFKVSTMVFSSAGSLEHLYGMIRYCIDAKKCRRSIIARHFEERFTSEDCNNMCDRCVQSDNVVKEMFVDRHCKDLYKIIQNAAKNDVKVTAQKLLDAWYGKGPKNLRILDSKPPKFSKDVGEIIFCYLLAEGYLREDFHFTPYSTLSYIKIGNKSALIDNDTKVKFQYSKFAALNLEKNSSLREKSNSEKNAGSSKKRKRDDITTDETSQINIPIDSDSDDIVMLDD